MAYDQSIIAEIRRRASQVKDPSKRRRFTRAAFQIGIVESGLQNLKYGDADSEGWRQERKSIYKDPTNVRASVDRVFNEFEQLDRSQPSWELAADVQRPAAQYRGRYRQVTGEAAKLAGDGGDDEGGGARYRTVTKTTPGVDNRRARAQLILSFLDAKPGDYDPVKFAKQAVDLRDIAPTTTTTRQRLAGTGANLPGGMTSAGADTAKRRADIIDAQRLPYSWGGGHQGKTSVHQAIPLDCSGAVSKVLGIDPRVADQFKTWGRPGDGGSKGITVYSKPSHVLMKINGHFFGTSASNPGGGAGWIPEDQISPEYLSGFTARHSNR